MEWSVDSSCCLSNLWQTPLRLILTFTDTVWSFSDVYLVPLPPVVSLCVYECVNACVCMCAHTHRGTTSEVSSHLPPHWGAVSLVSSLCCTLQTTRPSPFCVIFLFHFPMHCGCAGTTGVCHCIQISAVSCLHFASHYRSAGVTGACLLVWLFMCVKGHTCIIMLV